MNHPYRFLWIRFLLWLRRSWSFLWLMAVAVYLMVLAGNAIYSSYKSQQDILALRQKLVQSEMERERLQALLVYYQTDSFKEKELRRTLLMKRPSEHMYALPESSVAYQAENGRRNAAAIQGKKPEESLPVWRQWIEYVVKGEQEG